MYQIYTTLMLLCVILNYYVIPMHAIIGSIIYNSGIQSYFLVIIQYVIYLVQKMAKYYTIIKCTHILHGSL